MGLPTKFSVRRETLDWTRTLQPLCSDSESSSASSAMSELPPFTAGCTTSPSAGGGGGPPPGSLGPLAVFWDIENCCLPADVAPDAVGGNIRRALREHPATAGRPVTVFSAYADFSLLPPRIRQGIQRTGINMLDVPHCGKDAADKAILADLFLFALDNPPPSTLLLISSDVDFSHALQKLAQRQYTILLAVLGSGMVSQFLTSAAEHVWDWRSLARGEGAVDVGLVAQRKEYSTKTEAYEKLLDGFLGDGLEALFAEPQDSSLDLSLEGGSLASDPHGLWSDAFNLLYTGGWE